MDQGKQNKNSGANITGCAQKLERVKDKMVTAFVNACSNLGDDPKEAAYYYDRFNKYADLYGRHINKIFTNAGRPAVGKGLRSEMACKALGRTVDDINRLAKVIERKL